MSVLESCDDEKSVAAICYLLCLLMPRSPSPVPSSIAALHILSHSSLPNEVLQVKYSTSCKILTDQLAQHQTTSSTALLKSVCQPTSILNISYSFLFLLLLFSQLVRALALLLEAQPPAVWSDSHCQKVFQYILNFTVHPKPKVRDSCGPSLVTFDLPLYVAEEGGTGCSGVNAARRVCVWRAASYCCSCDRQTLQTCH